MRGDELRSCNAEQRFVTEMACPEGLCDQQGQQCDSCVPDSKVCEGNGVKTCRADGQGFLAQACTAPRRLCRGNGVCVECATNNDCPAPTNVCLSAICNVAAGTCETRPQASGTPCAGGTCDGEGTCGECRDGEQKPCGTDTGRCVAGIQRCSAGKWGACVGATNAVPEICNSVDDDCDGTPDDGASCTGMGARTRCIAGRCAQCGAGVSCPNGQLCTTDGICEAPSACGNGVTDGGEECDPSSDLLGPLICTPDCRARPQRLMDGCTLSPDAAADPRGSCGENEFCVGYGGSPLFCAPVVPVGAGPSACPQITQFTWVVAGATRRECLIPCGGPSAGPTNECPRGADECFDYPLSTSPRGICGPF